MKEKILICGILPPPFFGHSMIYHALMNSPFRDAFDITFLNMKFWSYEKHKKITVRKLLQFIKYYLEYVLLILRKRPRYVLYSISWDRMPFLKDFVFCLTGKILGRRIILHDMGQYVRDLYDSGGVFQKHLTRFLLRRVTAGIVLGEKTRHTYKGFMDMDRVVSLLGSVEDSRPITVDVDKKAPQEIRVLYFSFLSVSKGVWTALKSVPEVVRQNPHVRFVLAGPFESPLLEEEIRTFIKDHDLVGKVELAGYVGDEKERTRHFRSADIFIFPTHRDVFGLVLLHALAEGVPVVASFEGAIPEIIRDGENGFLFLKGDHRKLTERILRLAGDPALRERVRDNNRKRYLEEFTIEKYGQRMIEALERIGQHG